MSKRQEFRELCAKHFDFLEKDFGFKLDKCTVNTSNYKLIFISNAVGVTLEFEPREFYLFVTLCKLRNGGLPPPIGEISPETVLDCFDLDDVVSLRSKESLIPDYTSMGANEKLTLDDLLKKQAENLQKFANDILHADFSLFSELDKIVKHRARQFAIQKWGEKASQYGWSLDESK